MSGTPCRRDGKPHGKYYDEIVYGPSIRESTDSGYLAPIRVFAPPSGIESGVTGKLSLESASALLNTSVITGSAIAEMKKRAPERQAMVFCCDRKHSEDTAAAFRDAGISAIGVDSTMADRKERFRDFETKRVQVLVNVELATTGYDYPPVSLGIFLRDSESLALYLQMCGRFVRTYPGKTDALFHDHVGIVLRHGMPDADREWTLEGKEKRGGAGTAVRQCERCYAVFPPAPQCPSCGYAIPKAKAKPPVQRSGELEEVTGTEANARRGADIKAALSKATTLRDFQQIAREFGNKPGWAWRMHQIYSQARGRRAA
jgi:superfamily II DNA or RNA helicase